MMNAISPCLHRFLCRLFFEIPSLVFCNVLNLLLSSAAKPFAVRAGRNHSNSHHLPERYRNRRPREKSIPGMISRADAKRKTLSGNFFYCETELRKMIGDNPVGVKRPFPPLTHTNDQQRIGPTILFSAADT